MVLISGFEMVFTRVEEKYSPKKTSGFQTVYRSKELDISTVELIEERVSCFKPSSPERIRRQFFSLPNGSVDSILVSSMENKFGTD